MLSNAELKIQEAQYFLDEMRAHTGGTQNFMFKLSAFLTAARSVMDVLLYDYGIKYGLFTLNDRIFPNDFQRLAKGNTVATNFYTWWTQQRNNLATHSVSGFLSDKRHIVVHRGSPAMAWSLILTETISFHSSLSSNPPSTPHGMDVTAIPTTTPTPTQTHSSTGYFADYPSESVIDLCERYLQMLRSILTEAETNFP